MANIGGLIIIVVFSIIILFIRHKISTSDNEYLKTAQKVGDAVIWIRAILGLLLVSVVLFFLSKAHAH